MNRFYFSAVMIFVLFVMSLVPSTGEQSNCDMADRLVEEGKYEEALTMYSALLRENPTLKCAQRGKEIAEAALHVQAEQFYQLGWAYEEIGKVDLAREAYIAALKKDPTYKDAQEALIRLDEDLFAPVYTLADLGLYSSAAELLEETVKENPEASVPEDLEYLLGGKIPFLQQVRDWAEPWIWSFYRIVETIGKAVATLLIIVLGFLAFWRRILPWIGGSFTYKSRLNVKGFEKGATNLEIGNGLAANVEGEFKKVMAQKDSALKVTLVEGPMDFKAPADIKSATPSVRILTDLIEWAFPQKVINLCGCLQTSKECGAGLTLKLVNSQKGEVVATDTLWQKDYDSRWGENKRKKKKNDDPTPYYVLIKPAALWTFFQLIKYEEREEEEKIKKLVYNSGTNNLQSYFYSRTGLDLEELDRKKDKKEDRKKDKKEDRKKDKKEDAEACYLKALDLDPHNRFSLLNLGYLKIEEAATKKGIATERRKKYEEALKLLERAAEIAETREEDLGWLQKIKNTLKSKDSSIHGDNVWYTAMYQITALYSYMGEWEESEKKARLLVETIKRTRRILKKNRYKIQCAFLKIISPGGRYLKSIAPMKKWLESVESMEELDKWLEQMEPVAVIQYAMKLAGVGKYDEAHHQIKKDNLEKEKDILEKEKDILEKEKDILEEKSTLSYRALYNLSCYYSVLGKKKKENVLGSKRRKEKRNSKEKIEEYDKAVDRLEKALKKKIEQREYITWWARYDPCLKGVRSDDQTEKRFGELINEYSPLKLESL